MKTIYIKRGLKDNEVLNVTDKQFMFLNRTTNLTTQYTTRTNYYDGLIIITTTNKYSYEEAINEAKLNNQKGDN